MDDEGYEPPVGNMKDWDKNREWYDGYKKAFIDFQDPALGDCPLFPLYKIITKKVFRMIDYFSSFAPGWPRAAGAALTLLNIWCSSCVGPVNEWCKAATANILPRASVTAHDTSVWRLELETKVIQRFPNISQSRRRPLLGPSPGWKRPLELSHLRHYAKHALTPQ